MHVAFEILECLGDDGVGIGAAGLQQAGGNDGRDARTGGGAERTVVGLSLLEKVGGAVNCLGDFCVVDFGWQGILRDERDGWQRCRPGRL